MNNIKDYDDAMHYQSVLSSFHQRWVNSYDTDSLLKEFNTIRNTYYLDDVVADMKAEGYWDKTMEGLLK